MKVFLERTIDGITYYFMVIGGTKNVQPPAPHTRVVGLKIAVSSVNPKKKGATTLSVNTIMAKTRKGNWVIVKNAPTASKITGVGIADVTDALEKAFTAGEGWIA